MALTADEAARRAARGVGYEDWADWEGRGAAFALLTEAWRAEIATRTV